MIVLETERLVLRRLSAEDAEFILGLLNQPSFLQYIGDKGVRNTEDAIRYIQTGPQASYEQFGFGLYLVEVKESGVPMGMCGLLKRDSLPDVDIGFAFLPEYWSQGFAFEAAAAVMTYGREVLGLRRIVAITSLENSASIKLLNKIGLRFERLIKLEEDRPEVRLFGSGV
jgi:RimJ/RimL family protein N-acetyltransferase